MQLMLCFLQTSLFYTAHHLLCKITRKCVTIVITFVITENVSQLPEKHIFHAFGPSYIPLKTVATPQSGTFGLGCPWVLNTHTKSKKTLPSLRVKVHLKSRYSEKLHQDSKKERLESEDVPERLRR